MRQLIYPARLGLFLLLLQGSGASANETAEEGRHHGLTSLTSTPRPTSSSKRVRRNRSLPKFDAYDISLAERLASIASEKNFEDRLRQEEENNRKAAQQRPLLQRSSSTTTTTQQTSHVPPSWYWMSGILLLFGAATFSTPTTVWPEIQLTLTRVVSLQALTQVLTYLGSGGHALRYMNILWMTHLLAQQPALMQALREHVWPVVLSTTKKLLFAEAWIFVWKQVDDAWKVLWGEVQSTPTSTNSLSQSA